jgi:hypothetical protein
MLPVRLLVLVPDEGFCFVFVFFADSLPPPPPPPLLPPFPKKQLPIILLILSCVVMLDPHQQLAAAVWPACRLERETLWQLETNKVLSAVEDNLLLLAARKLASRTSIARRKIFLTHVDNGLRALVLFGTPRKQQDARSCVQLWYSHGRLLCGPDHSLH